MSLIRFAILAGLSVLAGCATTPGGQAGAPMGTDTMNVADAAIAGGNPSMALSVTQAALSADPNDVDAMVHEGDAYYALGRCPSAMAAYQLALTHDPKVAAAQTGLGRCLLKTDPRSAEIAFDAAVQDDPGDAAAYNDLGIARDLQGNFAGAVAPYRQALLDDPSLTAAEVNLGLSLALSGNGAQALQYLGPLATGQAATPKIREDYAAALVASGRLGEARQVLAIDLPPDGVNSAIAGFQQVIAGSQVTPTAPPPAPTDATVPTTPVQATPMTPVAPPAPPAPPAAPQQAAYNPPAKPQDPNAAYVGPSPIPVTASSSEPGPVSAPPAPPPATMTPHVAEAVTAAPAPAGAGPMVQLGALNTQDEAEHVWSRESGANPALFAGKTHIVQTADVKGHTYYRLRVEGFESRSEAAKFCGEVLAAGSACTLASF
jgi:Flp pilus assembly protein TadD